jgi:hypothetical protein
LTSADQILLKEYVALMGPIAKYLDVMQGERNSFLGCVIPCIDKIKAEITEVKLQPNGYGASVRRGILSHLSGR